MLHDRGLTIRGAKLALDSGEITVGEPAAAVPAPVAAPVAAAVVAAIAAPLVEPEIPPVPIPAAKRPVDPTPPVVPAIDLSALKAIRDRLRLALAA
jgi:hypothetical protein